MSSLPVAIRPKDGAELIWTAQQDKPSPVIVYSGYHESLRENEILSLYAGNTLAHVSLPKPLSIFEQISENLRAVMMDHSPVPTREREAAIKGQVFPYGPSFKSVKLPKSSRDYFQSLYEEMLASVALPIVEADVKAKSKDVAVTPEELGSLLLSEELAAAVLSAQVEGDSSRGVGGEVMTEVRQEVSDRVEEAIADIGYRWMSKARATGRIVTFDRSMNLQWCDQDLARLLVFELNIAIISARNVFNMLFRELSSRLSVAAVQGDWGHLQVDGPSILLVPKAD